MSPLRAIRLDGGYVVKRTPGRVHGTFDSAAAEAVRLTMENAGPAFLVMKIVGAVVTDPDGTRKWTVLSDGEVGSFGDADHAIADAPIEIARPDTEDFDNGWTG